ncbi:MAG: helix-turn-helix domain-containing protein [Clostridia bacterium]|nr:helix-turn-helix domain-containing protein [Clostridia bacterium]
MSISSTNVGINISSLRSRSGMTQQQLASALGVSHQAVSKWETGAALPDLETLMNISRLFGVTMEQLLSVPKEEKPEQDQDFFNMDEVLSGIKEAADYTVQAAKDLGSIFIKKVNNVVQTATEAVETESDDGTPPEQENEGTQEADREAETPDTSRRMSIEALLQLAPFMSREKVSAIVLGYGDGITPKQVLSLAPYLTKEALDTLLSKADKDALDINTILAFAPYLRQEVLFKLIVKNADELDLTTLKRLAPFLKKGMVDMLFDVVTGVKQAITLENLQTLADKTRKGMEGFFGKIADALNSLDPNKCSTEKAEEGNNAGETKAEEDAGTQETETDKLCKKALEERSWNWIRLNLSKISDNALLVEIVLTAARELGADEARDMLLNAAPYMNAESLKRLTVELCNQEQWDRICDLCPLIDASGAGEILVMASEGGKKALDAVRLYSPVAPREIWDTVSQRAIADGNWELVNALTEKI